MILFFTLCQAKLILTETFETWHLELPRCLLF